MFGSFCRRWFYVRVCSCERGKGRRSLPSLRAGAVERARDGGLGKRRDLNTNTDYEQVHAVYIDTAVRADEARSVAIEQHISGRRTRPPMDEGGVS